MATYRINFPRLGTFNLVNVWQKGKKGKEYRYELKSGRKSILVWLAKHPVMGLRMEFIEVRDCKKISSTHMKNKNYNYYLVGPASEQDFDALIAEYEGSNPMVPENLTSYMHVDYSRVNYKLIEKV